MTDLEMVKACAEAMGHPHLHVEENFMESRGQLFYMYHPIDADRPQFSLYDPLHDDAQAMALVKRFGLILDPQHDGQDFASDPGWEVTHPSMPENYLSINPDLNRAIVGCVARMWKAKG